MKIEDYLINGTLAGSGAVVHGPVDPALIGFHPLTVLLFSTVPRIVSAHIELLAYATSVTDPRGWSEVMEQPLWELERKEEHADLDVIARFALCRFDQRFAFEFRYWKLPVLAIAFGPRHIAMVASILRAHYIDLPFDETHPRPPNQLRGKSFIMSILDEQNDILHKEFEEEEDE